MQPLHGRRLLLGLILPGLLLPAALAAMWLGSLVLGLALLAILGLGTALWIASPRWLRQHVRLRGRHSFAPSAAEFRALADTIPTLCWMADADGWISWYNRRWYEFTGTTPAEMEGWGWQAVHDPEYLPAVMERWTAAIEKG